MELPDRSETNMSFIKKVHKMNKIIKTLNKIFWFIFITVSIIFLFWIAWSFFDVIANNLENNPMGRYNPNNAFYLFLKLVERFGK